MMEHYEFKIGTWYVRTFPISSTLARMLSLSDGLYKSRPGVPQRASATSHSNEVLFQSRWQKCHGRDDVISNWTPCRFSLPRVGLLPMKPRFRFMWPLPNVIEHDLMHVKFKISSMHAFPRATRDITDERFRGLNRYLTRRPPQA